MDGWFCTALALLCRENVCQHDIKKVCKKYFLSLTLDKSPTTTCILQSLIGSSHQQSAER
jgi:hypothetical protein